jgi:predicted nucleotidyltransferase
MPNMGTKHQVKDVQGSYLASWSVSDALFTTTQQRILGLLFGRSDGSYSVSELIALSGSGSGAVQRELAKLVASGLVLATPVGNQRRYQANPRSPVHQELVSIIRKTVGLAEPLRGALAPLASHIDAAFVYGSVAKGTDVASSDIDLMVVSDALTLAELMQAIAPLEATLGRTVNPTLYTRSELQKRKKAANAFIKRVLQQPRIWLIGSDEQIGA